MDIFVLYGQVPVNGVTGKVKYWEELSDFLTNQVRGFGKALEERRISQPFELVIA